MEHEPIIEDRQAPKKFGTAWMRLNSDPQAVLLLIFFLVNFLLVFYEFLPNLKEINFWDEAGYVNLGRFLVEGELPTFAQNPWMAVFYAILYLPFSKSPFWLVQICSLGRLLFFCMIWLSAYLSARTLKSFTNSVFFVGFLLVSPLLTEILGNPSDSMFTAMSGFAFWQLLTFWRDRQTKNLLWASVFVGLAALSRNDGVVLFAIFFVLSIFLNLRPRVGWKNILLSALPYLLLVGGYLGISGLVTGDFSLDTIMQRSYLAFEQGHEGVYEGGGAHSATINAMLDAREKFGTPQENSYSVFNAIRRNPQAYLARLKLIIIRLPEQVLTVYNKKIAALIFLLALRGVYELIRKKKLSLLLLLCAWPAYLMTYFLTFFREGYLRTPFFVIFILAGIGFTALFDNLENKIEKYVASAALLLLVVSGLVFNKLAIFYGAALFLTGLWAAVWLRERYRDFPQIKPLSLMVMFILGLALHGNYSSPKIQQLGVNGDEQAAVYLMENFPQGTKVGAGSPGVVWMAKQEFTAITGADVPAFEDSADFHQWLLDEGIEVIYLDYSISNHAPYFWELIQAETGKGLTEVFSADAGSNRIYVVELERQD